MNSGENATTSSAGLPNSGGIGVDRPPGHLGRRPADCEISNWFSGRGVLLTGATGFLGKALLEKLLRSCPGVSAVYLLVREKDGFAATERVNNLAENAVFKRLKREHGDCLWKNKLKIVEGDLGKESLNLSPGDLELLKRGDGNALPGVSVVLHCAANVRYDLDIHSAVLLNTRGTRELVRLACNLPLLESFLHVSTAFCHLDSVHVEEVMYPLHVDHSLVIKFAEKEGDKTLEKMASRLLKGFPNTYLFSKALAEQVINDSRHKIPAAIFRPSMICPSLEEPFPGWIERGSKGPVGILEGVSSGFVRTIFGDGDHLTDIIPVDIAAAAILAVAWRTGVEGGEKKRPSDEIREGSSLSVYNGTTGSQSPISWNQLLYFGRLAQKKYPSPAMVWYPDGAVCNNRVLYYLYFLLFQFLPAVLVDCILLVMREKPRLTKLQLLLFKTTREMEFLLARPWSFDNRRLRQLTATLSPMDASAFRMADHEMDYKTYLERWALGVRRYMMMAGDETLHLHRMKLRRLFWAHVILKVSLWSAIAWLITSSVGALGGVEKVTACLPCACVTRVL